MCKFQGQSPIKLVAGVPPGLGNLSESLLAVKALKNTLVKRARTDLSKFVVRGGVCGTTSGNLETEGVCFSNVA